MDCKTTSGRPAAAQCGASLAEFIIGVAVATLVLATVASFSIYSSKSMAGIWNYVDLDQRSQSAIDLLTKEVRQTTGLIEFATNRLVFSESDGVPLTYEYLAATKTLERVKGASRKVLLTECDDLSFAIFQRNPSNAVYDYFPSAVVTNCKMINVRWNCTRKLLGSSVNSESVQTAKIVIRKK